MIVQTDTVSSYLCLSVHRWIKVKYRIVFQETNVEMGHSKQEETYQWTLGTQEPTPIGAALVFQWTVKVPIIGPHNSHRLQTRCT